MNILGLDPGSKIAGYGLIQVCPKTKKIQCLDAGSIRLNAPTLNARLGQLFETVNDMMRLHHIDEVAIETAFVCKNIRSALVLGQARGVLIAASCQHQLPIAEYEPRRIKQQVTGTGQAPKTQVAYMVRCQLNLPKTPQADAADALAVALCHAAHRRNFK